MQKSIKRSAVLAGILAMTFVAAFEFYLRVNDYERDYDDNPELWADKRDKVYVPKDEAAVFIGSSRMKFDLDIPAWESATGMQAVQLSMVGSSPLHILHDLANDPRFKGNLAVDVTEFSFFGLAPRYNKSPDEAISYFHKRTPAQKAGFVLNHLLESKFVFLNKNYFSLNTLLRRLPLNNRTGVPPAIELPFGFGMVQFNRQNKMGEEFLKDTVRKNAVKSVWVFSRKFGMAHPASGKVLDSILLSIKNDVDRIRARGGEVTFVRPPSSGPFISAEHISFPRTKYWDRLLSVTGSRGVFFEDYPQISHFICPEDSHLQPKDAISYTNYLADIFKNELGWKFNPAR